jgi:hypothetical protein
MTVGRNNRWACLASFTRTRPAHVLCAARRSLHPDSTCLRSSLTIRSVLPPDARLYIDGSHERPAPPVPDERNGTSTSTSGWTLRVCPRVPRYAGA